MTTDREKQLISASIDGALDVEQRHELDTLLESSSEARDFRTELEELDNLLEGMPELDPPASLHAQIMSRTRPDTARSTSSRSEWLRSLLPGAGLRYALAAATGALVVAVFFNSGSMMPGSGDFTNVVGTMAPNAGDTEASIVDSFSYSSDGIESRIALEQRNGLLVLSIHVDSSAPLDIAVDLTGAGYQPDAVAQLHSEFDSIAIAGQALQMRAVGSQQMTVLLSRVDDAAAAEEAEISLEISSDGKLVQRGALTTSLKGERQ